MAQNGLTTWTNNYLRFLAQHKKRSMLTCAHYRDYLHRFYAEASIQRVSQITPAAIRRFTRALDEHGISHKTQNCHLIALRNFIRFLPASVAPISYRDIKLYRTTNRLARPVPRSTIRDVVESFGGSPRSELINKRNRAVLSLLSDTRMPLERLRNLKRSNLAQSGTKQYIEVGKDRYVASDETRERIKTYLESRPDHAVYLFVAHDRAGTKRSGQKIQPLTVRSIQRLISAAAHSVGHEGVVTARALQRVHTR